MAPGLKLTSVASVQISGAIGTGAASGFDAAFAEELLERGVDVFFVVDPHADEALFVLQAVVEDREQRAGAAAVSRNALIADLAVAEQVANLDHLVGELHRVFVVGVVIIPVRKMEGVDVPILRRVAFGVYFERQ